MDPNPGTENIGFTSSPPQVGVKKKNSKLWIIIVLAVILAIGGYFIFANSQKKEETQPVEVISPTEEPIATPTEDVTPTEEATTPSPSPRPTTGVVSSAHDLNIQVLNGSGTVGVAGDVKSYLAGKGYKNLETGNADNFDYTGVTVQIKSSQSKFLSDIQDDLSAKYTLASGSGTLSANSDFDVAIIVGK